MVVFIGEKEKGLPLSEKKLTFRGDGKRRVIYSSVLIGVVTGDLL